jgi:uncharacterized membrane protein (UPF0127 family)
MRSVARVALLLWAVVPGLAACQNGRSPAAPAGSTAGGGNRPRVVLHSGARTVPVRVELARTESERERGLMYRNHLEPDAGMLFIFDHDGPLTFCMKNTFIPLDMIFIDRDRRIVGIVENAVPETETPRRVPGISRYVLEVGGGLTRQWGIGSGSEVDFEGVPAIASGP